jgi:deazaflavin-dependent oxidoreductase (nitroreductase family)
MTTTAMTTMTTDRYLAPGATDRLFNRLAARLTRMGLSLWGSRELTVVGRRSGEPRSTVVNLLDVDGERYLVAPRGTTDWVRNVRAADGRCSLRVGRRREELVAVELDDADKPAILRPYLERWAFEVGRFFEGVGADASDEDLAAIAPNHPVFRLSPR